MTLMKEPCLPSLMRAGPGAGLRLGSSGRCPLCLPLKEPAARFSLWEQGFPFHLSSWLVLSSGGAERSGAYPLCPACDDAPLCRAGHGSPVVAAGGAAWAFFTGCRSLTAWCWDVPALRRRGSGSSASREGRMGDALARRGSSGERAGTPARPGSAAASQGFGTVPSGKARSESCGKLLLCGVKWRLSCRGAGARSSGASPWRIQALGSAFLSVKPM